MNPNKAWSLYIKYKLPDDPDLLLAARSLEANALNQRTMVLQTCIHSNDRFSCESDAEIAFREKISSIPGARFILCFRPYNEDYPLFDLTSQEAIDPQLNPVFHHLRPDVASPLRVLIFENGVCEYDSNGMEDDGIDVGDLYKYDDNIFHESREYSYFVWAIKEMISYIIYNDPVSYVSNCTWFGYCWNEAYSTRALFSLIDRGLNVNTKDKNGNTLLHSAIHYGKVDAVKRLIDHDADVNARDNSGRTPLMNIVPNSQTDSKLLIDIANILIEHGADVNARDNSGNTAWSLAKGNSHIDYEKILSQIRINDQKKLSDFDSHL